MVSEVRAPDLFPYKPRPPQRGIGEAVDSLARSGGTLLMDAPTGSGKTVAILAPLLRHAAETSHRVLYLVRTHSQATQVLSETRAISRHSRANLVAVTLEGRDGRCPLMDEWEDLRGASGEEYGKLCADRKRATTQALSPQDVVPPGVKGGGGRVTLREVDGCHYYATNLSLGLEEPLTHLKAEVPSGSEFTTWSRERGYCPYELAKSLAREARVVVAPYVMFFHPRIRESLLGWMGTSLAAVDIVVDEAHNLPDYLRELASSTLTVETLSRAIHEVEVRGNLRLVDGLGAKEFLLHVHETVSGLIDELPGDGDEGLLPEGTLEGRLLGGGVGTSHRLDEALAELLLWGDQVREARRRERRLPRSYAFNVATFLRGWLEAQPPAHLKVVMRHPRRAIMVYALDAVAAARPVTQAHLSVHMSGTLAPLEEYRDTLGLEAQSLLLSVPRSFPPENRRLFYSDLTTTRYLDIAKAGAVEALKDEIVRTVKLLPVKTALFFPSFALLDRLMTEGLRKDLGRSVAVERRDLSTTDLWSLLDSFKRMPRASVLLGVCGGRIAEGLDFPNEELEAVVLVGIPYPRPTARREALRTYLEATIGHGWEHAYGAPARRAMQQALGRMIRSETDRGIGVILDQRAGRFAPFLLGLEPINRLEACAREFYGPPLAAARTPGPPPG